MHIYPGGFYGNPKPEEEEEESAFSHRVLAWRAGAGVAGFARTPLAVFSSLCTQEFAAVVSAAGFPVHTEAGTPVTVQRQGCTCAQVSSVLEPFIQRFVGI